MNRFRRESTQYLCTLYSRESIQEFFQVPRPKSLSLCGRSNVGKSTLINALFRNKIARASKTPGKTREVQVFTTQIDNVDEKFLIFDLPGYGHARVSKMERKRWDELMASFFEFLPKDNLILHILDAKNPLQKNDRDFKAYITQYDFLYWVIFNKTDKLKNQKEKNLFKEQKLEITADQIFNLSALKKRNTFLLEEDLINFLYQPEESVPE